jgi:hypothetical protein
MQTQFQPYEAHIPYLLQFFVDYNLFGMSFVKFSDSKFRLPLPTRRKRVWRNIEYDLAASENASSRTPQLFYANSRLSDTFSQIGANRSAHRGFQRDGIVINLCEITRYHHVSTAGRPRASWR